MLLVQSALSWHVCAGTLHISNSVLCQDSSAGLQFATVDFVSELHRTANSSTSASRYLGTRFQNHMEISFHR